MTDEVYEEENEDEIEEMEVISCGRKLGIASGWDIADENAYYYYNFIPDEGVPIESGDTLLIDYNTGLYAVNDDDETYDLIPILMKLPLAQKI